MVRKAFFIFLFFSYSIVSAQESANFTQFYMNPYRINPSYAGIEGKAAMFLTYRKQWAGFDGGSPSIMNFSFHNTSKSNANFGLNINNDVIGIKKSTSLMITLGYTLPVSKDQYIRFGISGGLSMNTFDIDLLGDAVVTDPQIEQLLQNSFNVVGDVGLSYHIKFFSLGVSAPNIFSNNYDSLSSFGIGNFSAAERLIINTTYRYYFGFEDKFAIEPHVIYRLRNPLPSQYEAALIFHMAHAFWIGGTYKQNYGISGTGGIKINDLFALGYSYGIAGPEIQASTHEVQINFSLGKKKRNKQVYSFTDSKKPIVKKTRRQLLAEQHKAERERIAADRAAAAKAAIAKAEQEKLAAEKAEADRIAQEKRKAAQQQQSEAERLAQQQREEAQRQQQSEAERLAQQQREETQRQQQAEVDRLAQQQAEADRLAQQQAEADRLAQQQAEADRLARQQSEADRLAQQQAEADRLAQQQAEADRLAQQQAEADRLAQQQAEADRLAQQQVAQNQQQTEADRIAQQKREEAQRQQFAEAERLAQQQREEADRLAKEQALAARLALQTQKEDSLAQLEKEAKLLAQQEAAKEQETKIDERGNIQSAFTTDEQVSVTRGGHFLELKPGEYVIVGVFSEFEHAELFSDNLFERGYKTRFGYISSTKQWYVHLYESKDGEVARKERDKFRKLNLFKKAWVLTVE